MKHLLTFFLFACMAFPASAAVISGRVLDQDEQPVAGALVEWRDTTDNEIRSQVVTDKNGDWHMTVTAEKVDLTVSAPAFQSVDLMMLPAMKAVTIHLQRGATIRGRVLDQRGQPLANVQVQRSRHHQTSTAQDGTFQFTGLSTGQYYLSFDAGKKPLVAPGVAVKITQTAETQQLPDIVMTPGRVIRGKVTNRQTGKPEANVTVVSSDPQRLDSQIFTRTDAKGNYALRVPTGKRDILVINSGQKYFEQAYSRDLDDTANAANLHNFQIDSGVTLSGTAVDAHGKAMPGITVYVDALKTKSDLKLLPRQATTDADGNWSISGIAPRRVQLRVDAPWAVRDDVTVALPTSQKVLLTLIPQNELPPLGRLVDADGKPLAKTPLTVQYQLPHSTPFNTKITTELVTDADGYYRFRVPLTAALPEIIPGDTERYLWIRGGDWDEKTRRFSDAIFDPLTRQLRGCVLQADGTAAVGIRVVAVGAAKQETRTDAQGNFQFQHLPQGALTVLAISDDGVAKAEKVMRDNLTLRLRSLQQNVPSPARSRKMRDRLPRRAAEPDSTASPFLHHLPDSTQSPQQALETYREAFARGSWLSLGDGEPARMAAFLYDADAAEGKVLFDCLLQQYAAPPDMPIHKDVMQLAFYLARYQPLVSWELLQIDWARAGNSAFTQAGLALAMSALDFDEALRWARQINGRTGPDESLATMRQDTQRALYEMALMEPAVRRNVCIDCILFEDIAL